MQPVNIYPCPGNHIYPESTIWFLRGIFNVNRAGGMWYLGALTALFLALADAASVPKPLLLLPTTPDLTPVQGRNRTDSHSSNELVYYHIPGTTIDLYVRDTGSRLPFDDINACLQSIGIYIIRQITMHGDGPSNFGQRVFRHGTVSVAVYPHGMTWMAAGDIIDSLEAIVANDDWTWASHVTVVNSTTRQIEGYLSITFRRPLVASAALGDEASQPSNNSSVSADGWRNNTLKARPSDPYSYTIPETQISINFAGFGSTLNSDTVLSILAGAEIFVAGMVRRSGPLAPVDRLTRWKLDRVVFEIFPTDRLRWFDLLTALGGMLDFLETFGTFAFVFEINYQGYRSLGVGHMGPQT